MLEQLKEQVVYVAKEAERLGMCKHKSGNFSMFDPQTGYFVITPSGVDRSILSAEHICVMDLDANVVEWNHEDKPSSEALMHLYVYRERPDIRAVVHTHARHSTVFAILKKPIPPIVYECFMLGRSTTIPLAPYGRSGTVDLAKKVAEVLKNADCCLMESHGAIAIGESMEDAFLRAQYVEEMAELYYMTLTAGKYNEPAVLPEDELRKWAYPEEIKF